MGISYFPANSHIRNSKSDREANKRLDIQGLRMIAVLSVVVNHFSSSTLPGGFVGVDVFFVISGYLITGRLVRTVAEKSVRAYFGSFYILRARRILPAALVTLVLTVLASHEFFISSRAHGVNVDAMWSLFFLANWHFASVGTNYFNQAVATSPLQHFWSLAVEEQFYVVWPIAVLVVAGVVARRGRRVNLPVGMVAVLVIAASLAFGWHQTRTQPDVAYFSTYSRAWELGVGALLAALLPLVKQLRRNVSTLMSWVGMALIGIGMWITPTTHGFPVPWAAIAVTGSALAIAAGSTETRPLNAVLTNPVSGWIGDLSYSIYLFHFPVIIFAETELSKSSVTMYSAAAAGTLFLAITSYYFVEEPVRSGTFGPQKDLSVKAIAALTAAALALCIVALRPDATPRLSFDTVSGLTSSLGGASPTPAPVDPSQVQPLPDLAAALKASLSLTSWPTLTNQATVDLGPGETGCDVPQSVTACAFAPTTSVGAPKVVVLLGDSVMVSWQSMLKAVFLPNGWRLISLAHADCFAADTTYADTLQGNGGALTENSKCETQHRYTDTMLSSLHPSLVLVDDQSDAIYKVSDGEGHLLPHAQQISSYENGLTKTIGVAKSAGAKVVVMSATPQHLEWAACRVAGSSPVDCIAKRDSHWAEIRPLDVQVAQQVAATYIDTVNLWCVQGLCPDVVGNVGVIRDNHHITAEYGLMVAPSLEADFHRRGLV